MDPGTDCPHSVAVRFEFMIRRLFRRLMLWLVILVAIGIWRPDWRRAAQHAATPLLQRAAAPLIERVEAYRSRLFPGWRSEPPPADRPAPRTPEGSGSIPRS